KRASDGDAGESPDANGDPDTATFRVTRTGDTDDALTVNLHPLAGTAEIGATKDYTTDLTDATSVTIPADEDYVDIVVTAKKDDKIEGDETVVLCLKADEDYRLGGYSAEVVIKDGPWVDLDIDSDNNNGFADPDLSNSEEAIEDDQPLGGKVIAVNYADDDLDNVSDYVDGFSYSDVATGPTLSDPTRFLRNENEKLVPVVLSVSDAIDLSSFAFTLTYDASDPASTSHSGSGTASDPTQFANPSGYLRLWTRGGNTRRLPIRFDAASNRGDGYGYYVPSLESNDSFAPGTWSKLAEACGVSPTARTLTLWLEAVKKSDKGQLKIKFSANPNGDAGGGIVKDEVLVTARPVTKSEWHEEALKKAGIVNANWRPETGWFNVFSKQITAQVYDFYRSVFQQNSHLQWAGMARLASASVVGALNQMFEIRLNFAIFQATYGGSSSQVNDPLFLTWMNRLERNLLTMQKEIFEDLAWQHEAYLMGGFRALSDLNAYDATQMTAANLATWAIIDNGIKTQNYTVEIEGNTRLLRREQEEILDRGYNELETVPLLPTVMTLLVKNPIPGGLGWWAAETSALWMTYVTDFPARWNWIEQQMVGPWSMWSDSAKMDFVSRSLDDIIDGLP
ncbi:MAG: hypothetical protein H7144_06670, partial [Burkholderiales bacterium]|nr:hypothetical protein [Phycisphaerae bacterium]